MEKQIVLTKESYDAKVKELEQLKTTGRDEIAERIKLRVPSATFPKTPSMTRR